MKKILILCFLLLFSCIVKAQIEGYKPNVTPISPTAYQFLKFGEIPVGEYSGTSTVTIPIFTVEDTTR